MALTTIDKVTVRHPVDPRALLGHWAFSRTIDDRLAGARSTVTGRTELTAEAPDRIRWDETGTLYLDGNELPVSRTLFVELRGDAWFVTFEDGRDFHPWEPGEEVEHPCGADLYRGLIDVDTTPAPVRSWTVRWRVAGPAKDYTMTTVLTAPTGP